MSGATAEGNDGERAWDDQRLPAAASREFGAAPQSVSVIAGSVAGGGSPEAVTVTFLFSDIEGSTGLLVAAKDSYLELLETHRRLRRTCFARHGGLEVDTQGDSFFVVFSTATEAVAAAVEGQMALIAYTWPDGGQVRVRMGLHTGEAAVVDGDYVGLEVNRAARIAAAGHGGQILASDTTEALARSMVPEGSALARPWRLRVEGSAPPAARVPGGRGWPAP